MNSDELNELRDSVALHVTNAADLRWSSEQNSCSVAVFQACQRAVRYCLKGSVEDPLAYIRKAAWKAAKRFYREAGTKRREFSNQPEFEIQDMRSFRSREIRDAKEEWEHIMSRVNPRDRPILLGWQEGTSNATIAATVGRSIDQIKRRKKYLRNQCPQM